MQCIVSIMHRESSSPIIISQLTLEEATQTCHYSRYTP